MYNRTLLIAGVLLCMLISLITPLCVTPTDIPSGEPDKTNSSANTTVSHVATNASNNTLTDSRPGPETGNDTLITATGTVKHQDIEGGFYGIVSDDGENYLPDNLPPEYSHDGAYVRFTASPLKDTVSIMMWGQPVTILSIDAVPGISGPITDISGVQWNLTKYQRYGRLQDPTGNGTPITLVITDNSMISGSSPCGRYNGSVSVTGSSMIFGDITRSGNCTDKTGQNQQDQYLDLLSSVRSYTVNPNLQMADATNKTILIFNQ